MGAWCAKMNNRYQYIQIDFGRPTKIVKMEIQGRQDVRMWVTQFYVTHSVTQVHFVEYMERNSRKVIEIGLLNKLIVCHT